MIINYSTRYVANALGTMFIFIGNESAPPEPPVTFGPGSASNITIRAAATPKLVSGSNSKAPIGGSR